MPVLRLEEVDLTYGPRPLLEGARLELRAGERVCLVGRNGEGKSSLLRIVAGEVAPDSGTVWVRPTVDTAFLPQEVDAAITGSTVFDVVTDGLGEVGRLAAEYHRVAAALEAQHRQADVDRLAALQHRLEAMDGWSLEQRVEATIASLGLDADAEVETLSGGWRRRLMLARALVRQPELLLLDEPTNHLDIDAIAALEETMTSFEGALLFVSHDRAFVRRLATRVIELDRGRLTSWPDGYDAYLTGKVEQLDIEARHAAEFDRKLAEEERWIRRGIKARRTRNEGRVRALEAMREEHRRRRERTGSVKMQIDEAARSGKLVFVADALSKSFGDEVIVRDLSLRVQRGDRIGILGPNGSGKTTLIKLLLGELEPDAGEVHRGTKLEVAYFDQGRSVLDPTHTVMQSVADGNETVHIGGNARHVASYLRDFLFPPDRLRAPVSTLSGGERNRLLLARLFTKPANLLVLDEPTNDLDVETLELLEELVAEFGGTVLIVSHDRAFLDNTVTDVLAFEGDGRVKAYVGGYSDWIRQRGVTAETAPKPSRPAKSTSPPARTPSTSPPKPRKLSYMDQRELDALPGKIEELETEQAQLHERINDAAFYQQPKDEVTATLARLEAVNAELESCYERWSALET